MKLQFRHQQFQAEAAAAVCDVFSGQLFHTPTYMIDPGVLQNLEPGQFAFQRDWHFSGFRNAPVSVSDEAVLEHIRTIQRAEQIKPSEKLEGQYNLTIEMETGVGKTYTYIKMMYELNKCYGWSKFIIVVPSVAIREGVYKSFQITEEHFAEDYGKKIRYFIYNSAQLTEIDRFASDSDINVMIINSQAFNARGKDARRIYMKLDESRSRRPIDILAKTNPILIIDEPQSVEGAVTKERLKEFTPLFTLRYSATHRPGSVYNMIYRLDALEAYNKRLVKKIAVKGISISGSTATEGYVYVQGINLSKGNPTATIEFEARGASGPRKVTRIVSEGFNLFENSGELMNRGGITKRLIDFCLVLVRPIRGGLGEVNVVASMIFGGISGSSVADTSALGSILIPAMIEQGYPKGFTVGVTVASSTMGMIIPPSIPMIMYSMISGASVGKLFLAGLIPGILIGISQLAVVKRLSVKHRYANLVKAFDPKETASVIKYGLVAVIMPIVIILSISLGIATATESAGIAVLYACLKICNIVILVLVTFIPEISTWFPSLIK